MTNIVGGNTGNLSQPGSSHDGPSSNPLSKNATLDFLSLISVAFDGQKNLNGEASNSDGANGNLGKYEGRVEGCSFQYAKRNSNTGSDCDNWGRCIDRSDVATISPSYYRNNNSC